MEKDEKVGVLLMAHGGPDSLEDVEPFLTHIRGGRVPSSELVEEMTEHYRLIGGKSPLLRITREQAMMLEGKLNTGGGHFRVYVGMRYWHPFIKDALKKVREDGVHRVVAMSLAPHYSKMSVGGYIEEVKKAQCDLGLAPDVRYVESWNDHPLLLRAIAEKVEKALTRFPASVRDKVQVIFTAHSLPERIIEEGDPYPQELKETIEGVITLIGPLCWYFAYQSKGHTPEKWLGPEVDTVLEKLSDEGHRHVLISQIWSVSDNADILYEIDIAYRNVAESKGMQFERAESLNTSPLLLDALASIVQEQLRQ